MDTINLKQIMLEEFKKYTGQGMNDYAYLTTNESEGIYTIIAIATIRDKRLVSTVLIARLVDDKVIIERDQHDKTLAEALIARGVPESKIVLAYRGDVIPV